MKRIILLFAVSFSVLSAYSQNYNITVNSVYQPLSYNELMLAARANAARSAYNEMKYKEYVDKAYSALNKGDRSSFLTYSNIALQTGWYSAKLYYDRGQAFQYFHDYKNAKKEYKKAKKKGYYPAQIALKELKQLR